MALRMISYGYKMTNGILSISGEESAIVTEIFQRYGNGGDLKSIADDLTNRGIIYFQEKNVWNKNMIARIIENRKYMGEDGYPCIISSEDFAKANDRKTSKGRKKIVCSDEIEYLKNILLCAQCGHKLYRCANWCSREKWICPSGCKNDIYISDVELTVGILNAINQAVMNPTCLSICDEGDTYRPNLEVVRQSNEINRLMDQPNIQFPAIMKLIFQCAETKFAFCLDNMSDAHTEYILQCFAKKKVDGTFDIEFMKKVVDTILLEKDGSVTIILINKAQITGRR